MRWEIVHEEAYSVLRVHLDPGEEVAGEAGAMLLTRGDVEARAAAGGIKGAIARALGGGESPFFNLYRARGASEVWLAPPLPGQVSHLPLDSGGYILTRGAYLGHWGQVEFHVAWRGVSGLLAHGHFLLLKASGFGGIWLSAFGAIDEVEVPTGERVMVDNFHFVAVADDARYAVKPFGGIKTALLGGEGLAVEVEGPARLLVQTRQAPAMAALLSPFLQCKLERR